MYVNKYNREIRVYILSLQEYVLLGDKSTYS